MYTPDKLFTTIEEAKSKLHGQGYKHVYEVDENNMLKAETGEIHPAEEVTLDDEFSVKQKDGRTSIYTLTTNAGERGILLDGFGTTGSVHRTNFLKHLSDGRTIKQ